MTTVESVRQALVIAAGCGSRMTPISNGGPKPLVPVLGVPLIDRVIRALRAVGVDDIVVTLGFGAEAIKEHLGDGDRFGVRIRYATNGHWEDGNAGSVLAAQGLIPGDFLLVMADHLIDERILARMVHAPLNACVSAAVDPTGDGYDATHVLVDDGRIVEIGKQISEWNGTDIGVFLCSQAFLSALDSSIPAGCDELAAAMHRVDMIALPINQIDSYVPKLRKDVPPWWIDVDTPEDLAAAERRIVENSAKNASDALAHWVHRPIENALAARLARTRRISPNQVSIAVNILAYGVTVLFATGRLWPGVLLALVVGVADGIDGKLARITQQVSKAGALEHAFDMLYEYSWILALAWAARVDTGESWPLLVGGSAVAVIAFYRSVYDHYGKQAGRSLDDSGPFARRFRRVAGRRNLYNIWILLAAILAAPSVAVAAIAAHAIVTAVFYSSMSIRQLHELDRSAVRAPVPTI